MWSMPVNITPDHIYMVLGFLFSLYSCVSNDIIQTLGTFLSSNKDKPAWIIWLFSGSILTVVLVWGWFVNHGDMSFGRLEHIPFPEHFYWWHILPPIILIFLTRFGIPVATAFLILSVFSSNLIIGQMLIKSFVGYITAFVVAYVIYTFISRKLERHFLYTANQKPAKGWVIVKWVATGFLWSQWIMQDVANLFVYLPRKASVTQLILVILAFLALLGVLAVKRGGEIQNIVKLKTNTQDIRSAAIIDFIYACILLYFKEVNTIPISTTWVFVGLLAGREIAMYSRLRFESSKKVWKHVGRDLYKVTMGLVVSMAVVLTINHFDIVKNAVMSYF